MDLQLEGKVALVTGAASGIGKGAAMALAREGARVALLDADEAALQEAMRDIGVSDGALALGADVSQPEQMRAAVERAAARWGRLDVVFANAGINGVWAPIEELSPEEWSRTLAINLTGTFLTIKYAVPHLKRNGGSVIVTASVNGTRVFSNTGATAYSCSKAGQVAMTKMLALELAADGIRVNVICPGAIETNIGERTDQRNLERVKIPVQYPPDAAPMRPGTPEDVARVVVFLASDASRHLNGTELWIDAGESLLVG